MGLDFLRLRFFMSWCAITFPLAALLISTLLMQHLDPGAVTLGLAWGLLPAVVVLVGVVAVRTGLGALRREICVPEYVAPTPRGIIRRAEIPMLALLASLALAGPTHTLFAGGDVSLARRAHHCVATEGPEAGFDQILDLTRDADVALANLEGVVATTGSFNDRGERAPILLRGRPELLDVLVDGGFDLVTTANDHAVDYGPDALLEQHELLDAVGIGSVGTGPTREAASAPRYVQVGDVVLAVISVTEHAALYGATADRPGTFHAEDVELVDALAGPIATAREHADLVVVSPDWGKPWTDAPTAEHVAAAHAIVDLGADAILGHASHHLHGAEVYQGHPIVYDMGSLYVDDVGRHDQRYSAGWVLEFDEAGFHELRVHPLRLHACRATPAGARDLEQIVTSLEERSLALDPDLEIRREGDVLHIPLAPTERAAPTSPPDAVLLPGQARRVPDGLRARVAADVVLDSPPEWCTGEPVDAGHGVRILCARSSEAARVRRAFVSEVVLQVDGPLHGEWEAVLRGRQRDGTEAFAWLHPVADGAWIPEHWEPGQIVVDRTLVRPGKVAQGTYDLTWSLVDEAADRSEAHRLAGPLGESERAVGEIRILRRGVPEGPAGVSWDGRLPDYLADGGEPPRDTGNDEPEPAMAVPSIPVLPIGLGVLGLSVVGLLAFLGVRRRS